MCGQVIPFAEAVMLVFRDNGRREDRQKTRLMWLVEELGNEEFTRLVSEKMEVAQFGEHVDPGYTDVWKRRDILGVHPQKQEGLSWVSSSFAGFKPLCASVLASNPFAHLWTVYCCRL